MSWARLSSLDWSIMVSYPYKNGQKLPLKPQVHWRGDNEVNSGRKQVSVGLTTNKSSQSSLDNNCQTSTRTVRCTWSKKQRRAYSRIMSGTKRALYRSERVFFLTLTSGTNRGFEALSRDWDLFVKRVRRDTRFTFPFFKVTTKEGNGVIHALFTAKAGEFELIDGWSYDAMHSYFCCIWNELHSAYIVWCSICYTVHNQFKALCKYVVNQYVAGQTFVHMGYSALWCFRGFVKKFYGLIKKWGFKQGLNLFDYMLKTYSPVHSLPTTLNHGVSEGVNDYHVATPTIKRA